MKITFRQIQVFDAAASLGSAVAAADKIGMSQSAASSALKELQTVLKKPLFTHAKGQSLQLTSEGKRLKPLARSLLNMVHDFEVEPEELMAGTLVVGATDMVAETVLPEICASFIKSYPNVIIKIRIDKFSALIDGLQRMDLETVMFEYKPAMPEIELTSWHIDELWLVVAPSHPLADRKGLRIRDLSGMGWCVRDMAASTTIRLKVMLGHDFEELPVCIEASSDHAIRLAAMAGAGIACLSKELVKADVAAGRLIRLDLADFTFKRSLSLARPKGIWRSHLANVFDAFVMKQKPPTD